MACSPKLTVQSAYSKAHAHEEKCLYCFIQCKFDKQLRQVLSLKYKIILLQLGQFLLNPPYSHLVCAYTAKSYVEHELIWHCSYNIADRIGTR